MLTTPLIVPDTDDPDKETSDRLMSRQEKFLKLSQSIKRKLSSIETSQKIQLIGQKYGFELLRLANITRLVREYYFGETHLESFPTEIEKRMSVSLLTAQEIARYIKSEIIDWDPWGEYIARLPKLPIREIAVKHPKIAETEITGGYIEPKNPEAELSDPTIKNWVRDYVSYLGHGQHPPMERTQYLFHGKNAKDLSSPDREKLGIILKSFDENIPLPVDEENGEIVFDSVISEQRPVNSNPKPTNIPKTQPLSQRQEPFIKPYAPTSQPQRRIPPRPAPQSISTPPYRPASTRSEQTSSPRRETPPAANPEIDKFFNVPESPDIPPMKIRSITEHNEPRAMPAPNNRPIVQPTQSENRPQHKIIDPFSKKMAEPRLNGNIVDLSEQ